jgi:hypothetical protein
MISRVVTDQAMSETNVVKDKFSNCPLIFCQYHILGNIQAAFKQASSVAKSCHDDFSGVPLGQKLRV